MTISARSVLVTLPQPYRALRNHDRSDRDLAHTQEQVIIVDSHRTSADGDTYQLL